MGRVATEETSQKILASLEQVASAVTGKVEDMNNWGQIAAAVQAGKQGLTFNTGDQLISVWQEPGGTAYDDPFDVVSVECSPELKNGKVVHGMMIQQHFANVRSCPFDAPEALYDADEELAAGTYHFTVAGDTWVSTENGKSIQFTLTKPIPAGGQLAFADPAKYNKVLAGQMVNTYTGPKSFTPIESVVLSEGNDGTNLGTSDGKENMNHIQRVYRGNNNWKRSMLRQYLNSALGADEWWTKQEKWDRASSFVNYYPGYLAGFPKEFLDVLRPVKVCTARDTVASDGGVDVTYDLFFPISLQEMNITPQADGVEGEALPYWKDVAKGVSGLDTSGMFKWHTNYPDLRTFGLNAKTASRTCWLRSTNCGGAYNAWVVSDSGFSSTTPASTSNYCAPACVIVAPSSADNTLAASEAGQNGST